MTDMPLAGRGRARVRSGPKPSLTLTFANPVLTQLTVWSTGEAELQQEGQDHPEHRDLTSIGELIRWLSDALALTDWEQGT